jgi:predicted GNAT family N-acyltransferase
MGTTKRSKTLSKLTQALLAEGESERADFKRLPDGISADDLVAFANSEDGGSILAGVDEKTVDNVQVGIVRGCDVSDGTILQILNKAMGCVPPVSVDIHIENLTDRPILRIDVASSLTRPHCTPKGVYCRRDSARNRALHPSELLKIFLDTEARAFASRFEAAADRITEELSNLEQSLDSSIDNMASQLGWADMQLGDTESTLSTIEAQVTRLTRETGDVSTRLRTLFRQDSRDDPVRARVREKYLQKLYKHIVEDEGILDHVAAGGDLTVKATGEPVIELTEDEIRAVLAEAIQKAQMKADLRNYTIEVKPPGKCTESELDHFAAMVAKGGEVAGGLRARLESAFRLGIVAYKSEIVGTAAIKKPAAVYRKKVFENAGSALNSAAYPYELGWIYLQEAHRKKGQMGRLLTELMLVTRNRPVLSTTRVSNEIMQAILKEWGFEKEGNPYPSVQQPSEMVQLYLRSAQEEAEETDET